MEFSNLLNKILDMHFIQKVAVVNNDPREHTMCNSVCYTIPVSYFNKTDYNDKLQKYEYNIHEE